MPPEPRVPSRRAVRWIVLLLVALLVVSPLGQAGARRLFQVTTDSPAVGRSQVTTQGLADLPDGEIVYRVVRRTAPARGGAKVGRRVLSIVLATDEPVLLSNERADGTIEDMARVAPGESYLVQAGTRQIRSSLTDQPVEYLAVEIVKQSSGPDIGNGDLLFLSDPFPAPDGPRDIDFVRNVLEGGDVGLIPDSGQTVAVLATDGAIDILPANGTPTTLQAGESAIFPAGDLEIEAATATANGVPTNQVAGLTSSLQSGPIDAAYVVTVIGPEVPATGASPAPSAEVDDPTAIPSSKPIPSATSSATPEAEVEPVAGGTIGIEGFLCPATTASQLDPARCEATAEGYTAAISGAGEEYTLADAVPSRSAYFWIGVPLTTYELAVEELPDGYAGLVLPDAASVGGSAEAGYTITIDASSPAVTVPIYFLAAESRTPPEPAGTITVILSECAGYAAETGPTSCEPVPAGSANQPYLASLERNETRYSDSAMTDGNVYTWGGLSPGGYGIAQTAWAYDKVINGVYLSADEGYAATLAGDPVTIEIYDIRPPVIT